MISINVLFAIMMLCSQTILGKPISAATIDTGNDFIEETAFGEQQTSDKGNTNLYQGSIAFSSGSECPPPEVVCEKAQKFELEPYTWKVCTTDRNPAICHPWLRPGVQFLGSYSYEKRPQKNLGVLGDYYIGLNTYCPQSDTEKDCAICATDYESASCAQDDEDTFYYGPPLI